jgi:hypothetical protein
LQQTPFTILRLQAGSSATDAGILPDFFFTQIGWFRKKSVLFTWVSIFGKNSSGR